MSVKCTDRPARPGSSVMSGGKIVGTVTSGDWGHRTGLNLALTFVDPEIATPGTAVMLDLLDEEISAEVAPAAPYNPEFTRVNG